MLRLSALLLLLSVGASGAVEHRKPDGHIDLSMRAGVPPVPPGLRTALVVPSGTVLLGSAWQAHYVIRNVGAEPFHGLAGGDDRNSVRPFRYWVEAIAPDGRLGDDPLRRTDPQGYGGMGLRVTVAPGGEQRLSVNPRLFVRFDRPGRWTLRVFHDLGFAASRGDDDPRWASVEVDLAIPDAEQAAQVLAEHEGLGGGWHQAGQLVTGEERPPADFAAMAHPVYLPLLARRAHDGFRLAMLGIAETAAPEAVDRLLEIALAAPPERLPPGARRDPPLAPGATLRAAALHALFERLPRVRRLGLIGAAEDLRPLAQTLDLRRLWRLGALADAWSDDADQDVRGLSRALRSCLRPPVP